VPLFVTDTFVEQDFDSMSTGQIAKSRLHFVAYPSDLHADKGITGYALTPLSNLEVVSRQLEFAIGLHRADIFEASLIAQIQHILTGIPTVGQYVGGRVREWLKMFHYRLRQLRLGQEFNSGWLTFSLATIQFPFHWITVSSHHHMPGNPHMSQHRLFANVRLMFGYAFHLLARFLNQTITLVSANW
jgi:hypothetical protein